MNNHKFPVSVVSSCTNRKRHEPVSWLDAGSLEAPNQSVLTRKWLKNLKKVEAANIERFPARRLYSGRNFTEAAIAASQANHYIVSAGLGLLNSETSIPSYSLTVSGGGPDSLSSYLEDFDAERWWLDLEDSPFSTLTMQSVFRKSKLVVLALPSNYLALVTQSLLSLTQLQKEKLRIVGVAPSVVHPDLQHLVMPFDNRMDGPCSTLPGTKTDFAARAARLFIENVIEKLPFEGAASHKACVASLLKPWSYPPKISRERRTDSELKSLIRQNWDLVDGRSGLMLRHLRRKLGIACEQSRFKGLFKEVRMERVEKV